jgi:hypothetical protein
VLALTAFVPVLAQIVTKDAERAWLLSKVYFGALWIALLLFADVSSV